MKKSILISLLVLTASCSTDDSLELNQENITTTTQVIPVEQYGKVLIGTWIDTSINPENVRFDGTASYFTKGSFTLGPYQYSVKGKILTINYDGIVKAKEIRISNDSLYFAGRIYFKK